jgi:hypothetical protein
VKRLLYNACVIPCKAKSIVGQALRVPGRLRFHESGFASEN